ncbi:UBP-type zinc finger domain-containing protein [Mucilaginibacter lappiensis]|uniref:UBP-type zinc finger domain-containing protein n=1 Tax=Mucilaginibacter lappiensis TaxID=354630 RepID=UPI003D1E6715
MEENICQHLKEINHLIRPKAYACETCMENGTSWVHLRTCQTCGTTLCCDSSPNLHMTRHFEDTGHPVVISAEPGERWLYCYADNQMTGY